MCALAAATSLISTRSSSLEKRERQPSLWIGFSVQRHQRSRLDRKEEGKREEGGAEGMVYQEEACATRAVGLMRERDRRESGRP